MSLTIEEKNILRKALELEEHGVLDWEWWMIGVHPAKLMRLVDKGLIVVTSRKKTLKYRLADRERVKVLINE